MVDGHTRQQRGFGVENAGRREAGKRQIDAVTTGPQKWMTHHFNLNTTSKIEIYSNTSTIQSLDLRLVQHLHNSKRRTSFGEERFRQSHPLRRLKIVLHLHLRQTIK
jgi:hypothetical protein